MDHGVSAKEVVEDIYICRVRGPLDLQAAADDAALEHKAKEGQDVLCSVAVLHLTSATTGALSRKSASLSRLSLFKVVFRIQCAPPLHPPPTSSPMPSHGLSSPRRSPSKPLKIGIPPPQGARGPTQKPFGSWVRGAGQTTFHPTEPAYSRLKGNKEYCLLKEKSTITGIEK